MTAHQVQDYIDLVVSKGQSLGEHYVARQLEWGVAELERVQAVADEDGWMRCYECGGTGQRDGEECRFCLGSGFQPDEVQQ